MVLVEAQGPLTVRWALFCHFIWISSWFCHISVSGQYGPNYRRVLEEQVKRCERRNANRIGTIQLPQLILLALRAFGANRRSRRMLATPIGEVGQIHSGNMKFSWIFFVCCASPIGGVRIAGQIVLAQHKELKEQVKRGKLFAALCPPLLQKLPNNFAVLRKTEIRSIRDDDEIKSQNNAHRTVPGQYATMDTIFRPTLVFAGHYL